jgi:4,5-DOPA dioxygenase extradiol
VRMPGLFPTAFLSHGAPSLLLEEGPAQDFLRGLGGRWPRPRAVLCLSAHWETDAPRVTGSASPSTIHDFYGFPQELYRRAYPAPGEPELAERVAALLRHAGLPAAVDPQRGLDHGAWVPLSLIYPEADIPVIQLSLQTRAGPEQHYRIGQLLRPLREEGVLILGSGGATHNLRDFGSYPRDAAPAPYAAAFDDWLGAAVLEGRDEDLLAYLAQAPEARHNHPTAEHFLPLFAPLGARSPEDQTVTLHRSFTYGFLSMAAYAWEAPETGAL